MKPNSKKMKDIKNGVIYKLIKEFKWMYSFFRSYIFRIVLYILVVLFHTYIEIVIAYKVGNIVDFALDHDMSKVIRMGFFYAFLFFSNAVISIVCNRFGAWNYNDMQRFMVKKVFDKILHADWEELNSYHSGDLITRLSSDVRTVAGNANGFLTTMISQVLTILVSVGMIVFYDASMLLVVVVIAPIILISSKVFINKIYKYQSLIKTVESKETAYYKETFHNIQAVKAFGLADLFYDKVGKLEDERFKADMTSNLFSLLSWAVTYLGGIFSAMICLAWAFYRVNSGAMTFGTLSVVVVFAMRVAMAGKSLLGLIPVSLQITVSAERVRAILDLPEESMEESKEFLELKQKGMEEGIAVKVNNMFFSYKTGNYVFEGANLEAKPGEVIALVGPSGEGKTTMLRILLGILHVQQGEVFACINNNPENKVSFSTQTRQLIAYVPQGNTMLSGTIEDNMRMIAPDATREEIIDALEQACAYEFIKKLPDGIHHMIGEAGSGFSEGQNQRLAIARAILRKTPILLLDEATSALDVVTERNVLRNIMKEDPHRICILTTHRPSVLSMCHRVYKISNKKTIVIDNDEIRKLMDDF